MTVYFKSEIKKENLDFDYNIVHAESAGAALAGRLSLRNKLRILLLEAGPKDYNPYLKFQLDMDRYFMTIVSIEN